MLRVCLNFKMNIYSIILIAVGILIRWSCIKTLKKDFTGALRIPSNICKTGLYRHVRHPFYVGGFLIISAFCITSLSGIGVILLSCWVFYDRADREEIILISRFGQEYLDYMKSTKMFIPFII